MFFKGYFTIYVILDFTPYETNFHSNSLIFINNTYFTQIFSLFLQYLTLNTGTSQVIINKDNNCKNSIINCNNIYWNTWNKFFKGIRQTTSPVQQWIARSYSLQSTNSFTSFINVINLIFLLREVKTFFNPKNSSYLYLFPSLLVNFLNYLELCNIVIFLFLTLKQ